MGLRCLARELRCAGAAAGAPAQRVCAVPQAAPPRLHARARGVLTGGARAAQVGAGDAGGRGGVAALAQELHVGHAHPQACASGRGRREGAPRDAARCWLSVTSGCVGRRARGASAVLLAHAWQCCGSGTSCLWGKDERQMPASFHCGASRRGRHGSLLMLSPLTPLGCRRRLLRRSRRTARLARTRPPARSRTAFLTRRVPAIAFCLHILPAHNVVPCMAYKVCFGGRVMQLA